jgi:hypothetical protein
VDEVPLELEGLHRGGVRDEELPGRRVVVAHAVLQQPRPGVGLVLVERQAPHAAGRQPPAGADHLRPGARRIDTRVVQHLPVVEEQAARQVELDAVDAPLVGVVLDRLLLPVVGEAHPGAVPVDVRLERPGVAAEGELLGPAARFLDQVGHGAGGEVGQDAGAHVVPLVELPAHGDAVGLLEGADDLVVRAVGVAGVPVDGEVAAG